MTQTNYLQIDVGTTKQARAYQRKKEKKNTEEHKQFQQEAAIYLRVSSEMQKDLLQGSFLRLPYRCLRL